MILADAQALLGSSRKIHCSGFSWKVWMKQAALEARLAPPLRLGVAMATIVLLSCGPDTRHEPFVRYYMLIDSKEHRKGDGHRPVSGSADSSL